MLKRFVLVGMFAVYGPIAAYAQSTVCLPDTAKESVDARYDFGVRVSLTDAPAVAERNAFGLPALTEAQVAIVTDTAACAAAANAYYATFDLPPNSGDRFIVLQAGNRRIVRVAGQVTHLVAHAVFDSTFSTVISKFWH